MFKTHRYLAATVFALGALGALGTTTACAGGFRIRTAVVVPRDGELESRAENAGYRDGIDEGRSDARHHARYDPVGSRRYRSADHDYDRRIGPREEYVRHYRAAFERGYAEGYRGTRG